MGRGILARMRRACVLLCLASSIVPAQGRAPVPQLRGAAIGEVRDAAGKPWSGAEVVLLSRPVSHDLASGEADRVVARSDERGRFKAPILRGRPHTAWAWGEATASGRAASAVHENVFAGQPIVLRHERELPVRELVLAHAERWPGTGFRVRVTDELGNRDLHELDVRGDRVSLPWLVGAHATVDLFAVDGAIWNPLTRTSLPGSAKDLHLEVPERTRITCFARATDGTPLAGARILRCTEDTCYFVGTTDAAGKLALDACEGADSRVRTLLEGEDGRMGVFSSIATTGRIQNALVPSEGGPADLLCRVDGTHRVHARFLAREGVPLAEAELVLAGHARNKPTRWSGSTASWRRSLRTDRDGRVVLSGANRQAVDAHLVLRERDLAELPALWCQGMAPVVFAPFATASGSGSEEDPFLVDLTRLCPIELSFTGPGGTPLANVEVQLGGLTPAATWWPHRSCGFAVADERGRVRLLVPAVTPLGLRAQHGMSVLVRAFVTTPARTGAGPATATFEMPAPTGIRGRLLGKDGLPAADRRIHASFDSDNTPAAWDYASDPEAKLVVSGNALRVVLPDRRYELLRLTNLISFPVPTDADGRFALPLPRVGATLLLFQGRREAEVFADSHPVAWTGEPIEDLEWTIGF
jgi:hypothetical protein